MDALAETLVVVLTVGACAVYAIWTLLPLIAQRAVAHGLLQLPLPPRWAASLRSTGQASIGCACDGCAKALPGTRAQTTQVVKFHPRRPR